ncbi:PREDICTED: protein FAR1-RELATED SEQUENCE 5-like [Ipomoea nil]|nr:PREDICTED: protein FAR1-RELATED SEQUENCE 5-like [Ipomoea nil]
MVEDNAPTKRRRVTNRVGCNARIIFKRAKDNNGYEVYAIEERHNHLLRTAISRPFMKANRKLDLGHQNFIINCAKANIGYNKSFTLYEEMVGGFANVGATVTYFGNFKRDIMAYIEGADAQLVLDKYMAKKEVSTDFYFAHDVDELDQLCRIFWADPQARHNFKLFGDVMSFDATYSTNRYKMVFVPFTGVDHHKKSVTFAAGLITREDVDSYAWLLEHFKNAMGKVPACTVTDQDPAMRVAIARVFDTTRHRFCMWHIMTKVCEKVGPTLASNEDFLKSLNDVVWSETQSIREFETGWQTVMEKHNLVEHKWFTHLFEIRDHWIPAFFNDVFMGGLIRTTSRSESENNVFSNCTSPHFSLTQFFIQFEKAIDKQRHNQSQLNANCEDKFPVLKTPILLERQAAATYTIAVFYDVQKEIVKACFSSQVVNKTVEGSTTTLLIEDTNTVFHSVEYNHIEGKAKCSCNMF